MSATEWKSKRKGSGLIYTFPALENAIVDNRGMGLNPGIYYEGKMYDTVDLAKKAALNGNSNNDK